ncbi:precorrin-3B C(17)-methyltransferase [Sphingomonas sp. Mn802worker]|uniref:precorrin-3B C(17)-methyltransferase n=1 Tax=Sphingomonas sp. Mn802worker TaxID=629773 RepID=UPI0003662B4C|nr:precorrin-3B C(17)-methyltransferase [Sphingomonas sp. Mn802worker]
MSAGWLVIAGLGPGDEALVTPEVRDALAQATDVIGYIPYVARVAPRDGLVLHASDNRVELDRATLALDLAARGRRVVVVSSGDPGVFAMAAAVFEALEAGEAAWRLLDIRVLPGITAMLAAAARAGAPLGHDFCAINLSDNLKPWSVVERRVALAAEADFAIAFYNPRSRARPDGLDRAFAVLRAACGDARPVLFARAVTTTDETLRIVPLPDAHGEMADMRTMVIVGSSRTRVIERVGTPILYTPRWMPEGTP